MIVFRHLSISDGADTVSGMVLCYENSISADVLFETLISGYEANLHKKVIVKFFLEADQYSMRIDVLGKESIYKVDITGIDKNHIDDLVKCMLEKHYFFIITATVVNDELIINKNNYCCISEVEIDGELMSGKDAQSDFPLNLVKQIVQ